MRESRLLLLKEQLKIGCEILAYFSSLKLFTLNVIYLKVLREFSKIFLFQDTLESWNLSAREHTVIQIPEPSTVLGAQGHVVTILMFYVYHYSSYPLRVSEAKLKHVKKASQAMTFNNNS